MIKKLIIIASLVLMTLFSMSGMAAADSSKSAIQCGVNVAAGSDNGDCSSGPNTNAGSDINSLIIKIINVLSALAGAAAVIMLIYGGFRYVTSAGNDTGVAAAKKTIQYALIGVVIVVLSQAIVHFVLNNVGTKPTTTSSTSAQTRLAQAAVRSSGHT